MAHGTVLLVGEDVNLLRGRSPALEDGGQRGEVAPGGEAAQGGHELLGDSPALRGVLALIARVAPTEGSVLISGERGTGKELVARAIHRGSRRAHGPFVKLSCTARAEALERELFGHEPGALAGAAARPGRLEQAHGGTLFLERVEGLPSPTQGAAGHRRQRHRGGAAPGPRARPLLQEAEGPGAEAGRRRDEGGAGQGRPRLTGGPEGLPGRAGGPLEWGRCPRSWMREPVMS